MSGPRYPAIQQEKLTPEQRIFYDEMMDKIRNNGLGAALASTDIWYYYEY